MGKWVGGSMAGRDPCKGTRAAAEVLVIRYLSPGQTSLQPLPRMSAPDGSASSFQGPLPDTADVVVVGGGIAGTSAAHHLAAAGVDVLLLEADTIGGGATAAAVGVVSPPLRQPFHETVHFRGEEEARSIWEFALRSVSGLGRLLEERGEADEAGLDLSGGYLLAEPHTRHEVERSHQALEEAGLPVHWLTAEEVRERVGARGLTGASFLEGGGALRPGATAACLARSASEAGAEVLEGVKVEATGRRAGSLVCETSAGEVRAEMVVYATHVGSRRFSDFLGDEIVPIRGQGLRVRDAGAQEFPGSYATHWKMNVWRRDPDSGELHLGGWRHDAWDRSYWKMQPKLDQPLQADLGEWFESTFPSTAPVEVMDRWSGIFGWTADYLPLVGSLPGRMGELVISGFSGGGLPFAFESGRVIASIVTGGDEVPGGALLNPRRFT